MSHWQSQGLPVFCWNMTPVYRIIAVMTMGLMGCSESGIDGIYRNTLIHSYSTTTYSCTRRRSTKHGQTTADHAIAIRSFCFASAPTRANKQRDKHNSPAASRAKPKPLALAPAASKGHFSLPRPLHSTVSSFVRLRFCPSPTSHQSQPPPPTSPSPSLPPPPPPSPYHSSPSFLLPLLARAHNQSTACLDAARAHAARALIRPRAPPPPHRTLRHRARSPCPRPPQTLPWPLTSARL